MSAKCTNMESVFIAYRMAYPMHTLQLTIHSTTITLTVKLHRRHLKLHMVTDLDIK